MLQRRKPGGPRTPRKVSRRALFFGAAASAGGALVARMLEGDTAAAQTPNDPPPPQARILDSNSEGATIEIVRAVGLDAKNASGLKVLLGDSQHRPVDVGGVAGVSSVSFIDEPAGRYISMFNPQSPRLVEIGGPLSSLRAHYGAAAGVTATGVPSAIIAESADADVPGLTVSNVSALTSSRFADGSAAVRARYGGAAAITANARPAAIASLSEVDRVPALVGENPAARTLVELAGPVSALAAGYGLAGGATLTAIPSAVFGESADAKVPAFTGLNTPAGTAVEIGSERAALSARYGAAAGVTATGVPSAISGLSHVQGVPVFAGENVPGRTAVEIAGLRAALTAIYGSAVPVTATATPSAILSQSAQLSVPAFSGHNLPGDTVVVLAGADAALSARGRIRTNRIFDAVLRAGTSSVEVVDPLATQATRYFVSLRGDPGNRPSQVWTGATQRGCEVHIQTPAGADLPLSVLAIELSS